MTMAKLTLHNCRGIAGYSYSSKDSFIETLYCRRLLLCEGLRLLLDELTTWVGARAVHFFGQQGMCYIYFNNTHIAMREYRAKRPKLHKSTTGKFP
jgi:hypothetical protein